MPQSPETLAEAEPGGKRSGSATGPPHDRTSGVQALFARSGQSAGMEASRERNRDRMRSAIGVAACHALLGYALVTGLAPDTAVPAGQALRLFEVAAGPLPPPHEDIAPANASPDPEGAASPPNLEARPTAIVVPPLKIPMDLPSPVAAAPVAGAGADPSAGASDRLRGDPLQRQCRS